MDMSRHPEFVMMMKNQPTSQIASLDDAGRVPINVSRLIETRALVQANSGAGKTWLLRRLLEQTHGLCQQFVIDPEGEMHTLRERYDYVLAAASGGDCVADVNSAAMLARRLLELGVSAIIDISELGVRRTRFVRLFLEGLMSAPKDLWHPVEVVIDEADLFAPEKGSGEAESSMAVIDLMARGRKRGYAGILATQRISRLDKNAAAEANNRLIGRTSLDLDQKRAGAALGLTTRDQLTKLARLEDGHFYVFGPALCREVTEVVIGETKTSHARAGTRGAPPTPPRERVRQILAQLADLPAEAQAEARTVEELRVRVKELEGKLKHSNKADDLLVKAEADRLAADFGRRFAEQERIIASYREKTAQVERSMNAFSHMSKFLGTLEGQVDDVRRQCGDIENGRDPTTGAPAPVVEPRRFSDPAIVEAMSKAPDAISRGIAAAEMEKRKAFTKVLENSSVGRGLANIRANGIDAELAVLEDDLNHLPVEYGGNSNLTTMERTLLTVLAQRDKGLTKTQLRLFSDYSAGGALSSAFASLTKQGLMEKSVRGDGLWYLTKAGREVLGPFPPRPTGEHLRYQISGGLDTMKRKFFDIACDEYPGRISKGELLKRTGYSPGGAVSSAFAFLVAREFLVSVGPSLLQANEELF